MQEYQGDKLVTTKFLKALEEDRIKGVEKLEKPKLDIPPMAKDSTHQIIGELPEKGQEITLNGLVYVVTFVDFVKGLFHAKLKFPDNQQTIGV